jgi:D-alanyl-D-alanine carboxypeptidase
MRMNLLEECLAQTGWPGVTGAIVYPDGGELCVAAGFSDREAPRRMEPRDRMLAGSVGKTFAAVAALMLVEDGKIALDAPITRFERKLPWIGSFPQSGQITLRNVLAHRTGIVDFIYTENWRTRWIEAVARDPSYAQTVEDGIAIAAAEPPSCPPDTETRYADTNYLIAGRLVEAASGEDYYGYLQRRVLDPFALRATSPSVMRGISGLVPGYLREALVPHWGTKTIGGDGLLVYNPSWEFTGGGLVSNSADLARFMKLLFEGCLIGSAMLAEMQTGWPMDMPTLPNHRYGLGIQMFDSAFGPVVGHSGQFAGYRSLSFYFKDSGIAVALQTNADVEGLLPTFLKLAEYAHETGSPQFR